MDKPQFTIQPAKPYFPEEDMEKITKDIEAVLRGGMLTIWKKTQEFEQGFKEYTNTKNAIALNSGTAALHLSLRALGIKDGDEVIVPTNTFAATAASILMVNAKPVFADMNSRTYCIDPEDVQEKITDKTKAIIPVYHSGNIVDIESLLDISTDHHLALIEDAAHAHGSRYREKHAGTFGNTGCFSFYPTKNMTTAEGGMLITDDEEIAKKVRIMRDQGKPDFNSNDAVELGYNYRMSELHSILGIYQLSHLKEWVERRNHIAQKFTETIKGVSGLTPPFVDANVTHSFYKYMVLVDENVDRETVRNGLKERGVKTSLQYDPLVHQLTFYRNLGYTDENVKCPVSVSMAKRIFSLPTYNQMTDQEVDYVCNSLKEVLR